MKIPTNSLLIISTYTMGAYSIPAPLVKPMAMNNTLTMESVQRTCNEEDKACHWSFTINVDGIKTECAFDITGSESSGASFSANTGRSCGKYTVTSNWSGQFGPKDGFITLSVIDYLRGTIAWPAYRDDQLESGVIVMPDQSYPIQSIP